MQYQASYKPKNKKTIPMINATAAASGTVFGAIDTIGYDYLKMDMSISTTNSIVV